MTHSNPIPNLFPSIDSTMRLAIIDDLPDRESADARVAFTSKGMQMIKDICNQQGLSPFSIFFGYLCSTPDTYFDATSPNTLISLSNLKRDLDRFKPNCILFLTKHALALTGKHGFKVDDIRGSLFAINQPNSPFHGYKALFTYHPSTVFIQYSLRPFLIFDIRRAVAQSRFPELDLPQRVYDVDLSFTQCLQRIQAIQPNSLNALDIEGTVDTGITCLSIATSPHHAFIVPFDLYSPEETTHLIMALRDKGNDPTIGWILQHALYDTFALAWCFQVLLRNIYWDTMLSGWEHYPELPKALGVQTSFWTLEPYYKFERIIQDARQHYIYCCKDSCVTYELYEKHLTSFTPTQHEHFRFTSKMLYILLYFQLRGIRYDLPAAKAQLQSLEVTLNELRVRVNTRAGTSVNLDSPKQLNALLYKTLRLPPQHPKKTDGRGFDKTRLTSDTNALLKLLNQTNHPIIPEILAYRKLIKIAQALNMEPDPDGKIRCSYNAVGTETGRLSCSKSPTGRGGNLQTVTKKLRYLYKPEPDHYFFQVDLAGADGWTVAAHCNALGDPTMLDDYLYGIKPARVIAYMYLKGPSVSSLPRDVLHAESKYIGTTEDTDWLYFTCKRVQHGTNYLLGIPTMVDQIMKDSYKLTGNPLRIDQKVCRALQTLYKLRYKGVAAWQDSIALQIARSGQITSQASGHTRTFFGRRSDNSTHREACAHEPQHNTTYVLNRALINLWEDPTNRRPNNSLIIDPFHTVHDSMNGQFPTDNPSQYVTKIKSYFDFTVTIANQQIHIPFEGTYGEDWYHQQHEM
jgi:DNA polymerase I-like protein with 3'-5' exonuclease and polymerase domains